MAIEKILIVDDDANVRSVLFDLLNENKFSPLAVSTLAQAREAVQGESYDLVLCDVHMRDGDGLDLLKELKAKNPAQKMIVMTGFASMDSAVKALRIGVFDYLIKPIDPIMLSAVIDRLNDVVRLEEENRYLRSEMTHFEPSEILLGESPVMRAIDDLIRKAGPVDTTVLIQGESGTGKEMVARALHIASPRSGQPFIKVNCAAIPAALMESEFFGHEKGSFTGATQRRQGRFELADGGTLLLDEISEISTDLQVKLLRVLQEKEFERVGGQKTIPVDVRVIATTNRDLLKAVGEGKFREDLFYRLNVFPIHLPPLRARGEDVITLAQFFLQHFARRHGKSLKAFAERARERLLRYSWPGNVRELQNVIERAVIVSDRVDALTEDALVLTESKDRLKMIEGAVTIAEMEKVMIVRALESCGGNRTHAARQLGISLRTLRNRLSQYRQQDATHQ